MRGEDAKHVERPAPAADLSTTIERIVRVWRDATMARLVHNNPRRIGVVS